MKASQIAISVVNAMGPSQICALSNHLEYIPVSRESPKVLRQNMGHQLFHRYFFARDPRFTGFEALGGVPVR